MKKVMSLFFCVLFMVSMIKLDTFWVHSLSSYNDAEAALHEEQIISKATKIYNSIINNYSSIEGYINKIASDKNYYTTTFNEADFYNQGYSYVVNFSKALAKIGVSVVAPGSTPSKVIETIGKQAFNIAMDEITKGIPAMSTKEFIYSQARDGLSMISYNESFNIAHRVANKQELFPSVKDAINFILEYQSNKLAFSAATMGKNYYMDQLNQSPWDVLGTIAKDVAVSEFKKKILPQSDSWTQDYAMGKITKIAKNSLFLVVNTYKNEHLKTWYNEVVKIENETEELLRYEPVEPVIKPIVAYIDCEPNGGLIDSNNFALFQSESYNYLPQPFRFGYTFLGWYDAPEGGSLFDENSNYFQKSNLKLYARWSRDILESGTCGDNLSYVLYGDGLLEITGTGLMTSHPWNASNNNRIGEVKFPNGITNISENAFSDCKYLHEINLPSSVKVIGNSAFKNSGLTSLNLPNGIEKLGYHMLYGNTGVKELVIPGSVVEMEITTGTLVSGFFRGTFENSGLEKVILQNGITKIAPLAFLNCRKLKEVSIPDSVTLIQYEAFENCTSLEEINLPDSITNIEYRAFQGSGLKELNLPQNIISIGSRVLAGNTSVKSLFIPKSFTSAGTTERLNDSYSMLYGSAVELVEFENGINKIPANTLLDAASTKSINLPSSVKVIGNSAFKNSGLTSLNLPNHVITIEDYAAYRCTALKSVRVFGGVNSIGDSAFSGCNNVTIYCPMESYVDTFATRKGIPIVYFGQTTISVNSDAVTTIRQFLLQGNDYNPEIDINGDGSIDILDLIKMRQKLDLLMSKGTNDVNGDGETNAEDLVALLSGLLQSDPPSEYYDISGDGVVNILDLIRLKKVLAETIV